MIEWELSLLNSDDIALFYCISSFSWASVNHSKTHWILCQMEMDLLEAFYLHVVWILHNDQMRDADCLAVVLSCFQTLKLKQYWSKSALIIQEILFEQSKIQHNNFSIILANFFMIFKTYNLFKDEDTRLYYSKTTWYTRALFHKMWNQFKPEIFDISYWNPGR